MPKLTLTLTWSEKFMLGEIGAQDLRNSEQTLRWLLRQEADKRGIETLEERAGRISRSEHIFITVKSERNPL